MDGVLLSFAYLNSFLSSDFLGRNFGDGIVNFMFVSLYDFRFKRLCLGDYPVSDISGIGGNDVCVANTFLDPL